MYTKQFAVRIKAAGTHEGTDEGVFEALAATYDLDSVGDKIVPGAFADTLDAWEKSGDSIPLYWSHRMDDPHMNIGHVLEAKETDEGLWVKGQLDLEAPTGAQVYRLLKGRRVGQMSFAYDVEDADQVDAKDGDGYYELRKLKLHEVSVVPIGANQNTEVLAVKATADRAADAVKAGRTLSAKNEAALSGALEKISAGIADMKAVLASVKTSDDDEKATSTPPAVAEEPVEAKAVAPARPGPASLRLLADLDALCAEAM